MRLDQIDLESLKLPVILRPYEPVSDDNLLLFSERNKPYKIERNREGEIVIMTPVTGRASVHEAYVSSSFYQWNETVRAGQAFLSSAGFNLPDGSCLSPDASWISNAKWNALTPEEQDSYPPVCPEFIIEVRSKSDPLRIIRAKMIAWIDNGATLAWLVDPIDANVTIYEPGKEPLTLDRPEIVTATDPVAGFTLPCRRLWPN